jgi:hypothetical protein
MTSPSIQKSKLPIMASKLFLHGLIPLAAGAAVYVLLRSESLLVFSWLHFFGLHNSIASVRSLTLPAAITLPDWFLYSLPDGIWVYCTTSTMCLIWKDSISVQGSIWIAIGFVAASTTEVAQLVGLLPGTFDPFDLLSYSFAFILACFVTYSPQLHRRSLN